MADAVFGEAQLLPEVAPLLQQGDEMLTSGAAGSVLEGWAGDLQCVDEALMQRIWRRLLADEDAIESIRRDSFLGTLHGAIMEPLKVPSDTNSELLARALIYCSDANRLLPLIKPALSDGELIRVMCCVSSCRGSQEGWTLRVSDRDGKSYLIRFGKEAFFPGRPAGLRGADVLVLAVVQDARKFELRGVALLVRTSV